MFIEINELYSVDTSYQNVPLASNMQKPKTTTSFCRMEDTGSIDMIRWRNEDYLKLKREYVKFFGGKGKYFLFKSIILQSRLFGIITENAREIM